MLQSELVNEIAEISELGLTLSEFSMSMADELSTAPFVETSFLPDKLDSVISDTKASMRVLYKMLYKLTLLKTIVRNS